MRVETPQQASSPESGVNTIAPVGIWVLVDGRFGLESPSYFLVLYFFIHPFLSFLKIEDGWKGKVCRWRRLCCVIK